MSRKNMSIFQIDDVLVSSEILTEFFACDYEKCKGVCCIIGDSGAPLEEHETDAIANQYEFFAPLLSDKEKKLVEEEGFYVVDEDGDKVTPLMRGGEECAYTCFDSEDKCFCAIERTYFAGKCSFRKPISCRLYPIRVSKLSSGLTALNLHRWHICKDAYRKGRSEKTRVYKFLKDPIIFSWGEDFYDALEAAAKSLDASS